MDSEPTDWPLLMAIFEVVIAMIVGAASFFITEAIEKLTQVIKDATTPNTKPPA